LSSVKITHAPFIKQYNVRKVVVDVDSAVQLRLSNRQRSKVWWVEKGQQKC